MSHPVRTKSDSKPTAASSLGIFYLPGVYTNKAGHEFLLFFRLDFMPPTSEFIYDQVPYEGYSITPTHPDRIIPIAALLGLTAAPAAKCRVLELGCGDGVNLIPMA